MAQETTGSIVGAVRDQNGAAVAGATVTITEPTKDNNVVRTTTTSDDGVFSAPNLYVSVYNVTVEAPNFKKFVQTDVKLDVNQRRNVDVTLETGSVAEVVTVEADQVAVELNTPTASTTINGDQVRELSINNRNFTQLVALAPGVSSDLSDQVFVGTVNPDGQANTVNLAVNGARSSQNTFTVDGADITDRGSNLTIQAYPSVDSIGEFKVQRSLFTAETGGSGGGQVTLVTRSGTSEFHGSLFEFVRNEKFNANPFFNNLRAPNGIDENGKARRAPFRYNNFGGTIGGPVYFFKFGEGEPGSIFKRYDRTFFFFSEELRRDIRYPTFLATVPDANLRRGVFPIDVCINRNLTAETCTGANRLAAGTPLSADRFNPVALAYLNQVYANLPVPNNNTTATPYQLISTALNRANFRQEILKIDHSFTDSLTAFYRFQNDDIPTFDANALFSSGSGLPGVATTITNSPGRTHTVQTTYAIQPKTILDARYSYAYGAILSENVGTLARNNTNIPVTLPFAVTRDRVPTVSGNGFSALQGFGFYDNFSDKHAYNTNLNVIRGNHTMKFGAAYSLYRKNENAIGGNNEGIYSAFSATLAPGVGTGIGNTLPTGINLATAQNVQRFANFLVGNFTTFTQASFDYIADLRQRNVEFYAQDEWRLRSNLTLYLGVRYSYFGQPLDKNGRLTNFDPDLYNRQLAPVVNGAGNRSFGTVVVNGVTQQIVNEFGNVPNICNGLIVNTNGTAPNAPGCTLTASEYGEKVVDTPKRNFAPRIGLAFDPFSKGRTSIRTGYGIYHEQTLNGVFLQNIGTNPPFLQNFTVQNRTLDNVIVPNQTVGATSAAAAQTIRAVQTDWKTPYMQHWSLDVQQQLAKDTIVTVGYYGSKGTNLIGIVDINLLPPGQALNSQCAAGANSITSTTARVQCQPAGYAFRNSDDVARNPNVVGTTRSVDVLILDQLRPYRGYRSINMIQPRFNSNYHSLQVSGQRRFGGASQLNVNYTFSKNLTDAQTDRSSSPQNPYNIRNEYGRAALDRRHIFTANFVYELPFFQEQQGFIGKLLGGYQLSSIITYNTGIPFTATTTGFDAAGIGFLGPSASAPRPDQIGNPNADAPNDRISFFNTAAFAQTPAAQNFATAPGDVAFFSNTVGNAGRGTIFGPSTKRVDLTLTKNIRFTESIVVQLRGEGFNIFNTTNFRTFDAVRTSGGFGNVVLTRDPRVIQLGAKLYF